MYVKCMEFLITLYVHMYVFLDSTGVSEGKLGRNTIVSSGIKEYYS